MCPDYVDSGDFQPPLADPATPTGFIPAIKQVWVESPASTIFAAHVPHSQAMHALPLVTAPASADLSLRSLLWLQTTCALVPLLPLSTAHVVEQLCCNTHHILIEVTFTHASDFIHAGGFFYANAFHLWSCRPAEVEVVHARMIKVIGVRMTEKRWPTYIWDSWFACKGDNRRAFERKAYQDTFESNTPHTIFFAISL